MSGFWGKHKIMCCLAFFAASVVLFFVYLQIYVGVLGLELPKTRILKRQNAALVTQSRVLGHRVGQNEVALDALALRDEDIYRSIFGLGSIPESVRNSGLDGANYSEFDKLDRKGNISALRSRSDVMVKKAFVQSRSFDEIELMLATADNMATSVPAICPIAPVMDKIRISSPFGYRIHPVLKYARFHKGIDFNIKPGNPVFATGDGVVESIAVSMRGYGRQIVINHGFGYKTRYAHLKSILVTEGMKVKRGDRIAISGNSGLSSGPHLHYEVIYKGKNVNPYFYFDRDITLEQYSDMVGKAGDAALPFYIHPSHRKVLHVK